MLLFLALFASADAPTDATPGNYAPTTKLLTIRAAPSGTSEERGKLAEGEVFAVTAVVEGPGCRAGWGQVGIGAFTCLNYAEPAETAPVRLPRDLSYEPPFPTDYANYSDNGVWTHRGTGEDDLLPFVYARRWKEWRGRVYTDAAAYESGAAPSSRLPAGRRARFVDAAETSLGVVLIREDGTVVPEEDVYVFPITRFQGRDLIADPLPEGHTLAWATNYEDAPLYREPTLGEPEFRVAYHQSFVVVDEPVRDHIWRAPNAFSLDEDGYVDDRTDVRVFQPAERPDDVGPDEMWFDLEREATVLAVYRGDTPIYVTLTSPGTGRRTPIGTWRIQDKRVWHDMQSRAGSDDPYYVEAVPWTMFFKPMYAIHGAYWHWGFGHKASHGCINVAPRDARWLFEHAEPQLPVGWHTINADDEDLPGTWFRIR